MQIISELALGWLKLQLRVKLIKHVISLFVNEQDTQSTPVSIVFTTPC